MDFSGFLRFLATEGRPTINNCGWLAKSVNEQLLSSNPRRGAKLYVSDFRR